MNYVWSFLENWCKYCYVTAEVAETDGLRPCVFGWWLE